MSIQHSGDAFIYTEPGIRVNSNRSSVRVSIDRRGYSRHIEDYGGGDIYDNTAVRRGNRRLMVESTQHSFRVKESFFDDHEHLIAELTRYDNGAEGYVLTNPYYRTSSYLSRPELRGESRYYSNYEQWLDEALLTMEKVAALEIPEAPVRAAVRSDVFEVHDAPYRTSFDPAFNPYGPIRELVTTPAARPRRYRVADSEMPIRVEEPIDLPHPIAVDPIVDCPPRLTADELVAMRSQLTYENLNQIYDRLRTNVN